MYIISAAVVSPQKSLEQMFTTPAIYTGEKLACIEPDYTKYIDAKLIRRMSRIIKMGVAAASECLQAAGINNPDAIITGTAYGCLADTDQFLTRMVEFNEELLSPTAFIQSTHNTVGAQIALMLGCHNYNNTYVHRGSSFEAGLTDALSLMEDGEANTVLMGSVDEIIDKSHAIIRRLGGYKADGNTASLINSGTKGTMAGEGAAFFVISNSNQGNALAKIDAFTNSYKTNITQNNIIEFLEDNKISLEDIDAVLVGKNGDEATDKAYDAVLSGIVTDKKLFTFKQYCGEYPTSSSFALWMATQLLQKQEYKRILIYNNYKLQYPALYVLSAC